VTRPLGASVADWFSKHTNGGLGLGDGTVSAIALVVFVALVAYVASTRRDIQSAAVQERPHRHLGEVPYIATVEGASVPVEG